MVSGAGPPDMLQRYPSFGLTAPTQADGLLGRRREEAPRSLGCVSKWWGASTRQSKV
jgi:hypothetical protein